ncbi:MAG: potassium transporter TrkA [Planctomycetota bacterium]|nr:MAG: potassium transporter TrkA [Planctomycetota bacterium]REK26778.1 MAG: potassium transporter TrkA [Planctomycetota bacterium]REK35722.1 MAG: potassium transporter TrkA [Planctomycetota bacterium]
MIAILSPLIAVSLSLLITRVAAMSLMLTGLSREAARFQARSAFSGVGFTTGESESIVNHPVRRRIVMVLMLLGNAGIATVVATLMVSFVATAQAEESLPGVLMLAGGFAVLWYVARSRWIERRMNRMISYALRRWARMEVRDYVAVLHLQSGYAVTEMQIEPTDWLAEKSLQELRLPDEGVLVLGIIRGDGKYVGAPVGETVLRSDDVLVLYGPIDRIEELDQRRAGRRGDEAHREAVMEHEEVVEEQVEAETETAAD